jgi:uncharacterized repeat protein (TIGR01451 family)
VNRVLCTLVLAASLLPAAAATGADLAVDVTGPPTTLLTQTFMLTVALDNVDNAPATNVVLTIPLPEHVTFVSMVRALQDPVPECVHPAPGTGGTIVCTIPVFANATYFVYLRSNPPLAEPDTIRITATLTQETPDPNSSNNEDSVDIGILGPADLAVTKRLIGIAPDPQDPIRDLLTYEAIVTNLGPNASHLARVVDTPNIGSYRSHSCENGLRGAACCFAQCEAMVLPAHETMTLHAVFTVDRRVPRDSISNSVTVTSASDLNPANDTATVFAFSPSNVPLGRGILAMLTVLLASAALFVLRRS